MIYTTYNENSAIVFNEPKQTEKNNNGLCDYVPLNFSGNNGGRYMHDALYESYIQSKIDSEDRLAFALMENMVITEADYSNIQALHEASLGDRIKVRWKKFIAFIKGLVAKFIETMSNILLDEKEYLEKYKDIILEKKPKDIKYSYTGNYKKGVNRIIAVEVPLFDYAKFKNQLDAEGNGELVKAIMINYNGFKYDDSQDLPELFKGYFLASDYGEKRGSLSDSDINMTDIYNFCYNFNKIEGIVNKDTSKLDASTKAIEDMIVQNIRPKPKTNNKDGSDNIIKSVANTFKKSNKSGEANNETPKKKINPFNILKKKNNSEEAEAKKAKKAEEAEAKKAKKAEEAETDEAKKKKLDADKINQYPPENIEDSAFIDDYTTVFYEADEKSSDTNLQLDKETSNVDTLVHNTSYKDSTSEEEKEMAATGTKAAKGKTEEEINTIAKKWIEVCRALISAKLTACQQIAKDYMEIIRAHVRSYGGQDSKSKEGNKPRQIASKYSKAAAKAEVEAKKSEDQSNNTNNANANNANTNNNNNTNNANANSNGGNAT